MAANIDHRDSIRTAAWESRKDTQTHGVRNLENNHTYKYPCEQCGGGLCELYVSPEVEGGMGVDSAPEERAAEPTSASPPPKENPSAIPAAPSNGGRDESAAPKPPLPKKKHCAHYTITTNKRTGQARCYSCGKMMPNALLSKDQKRLDTFLDMGYKDE